MKNVIVASELYDAADVEKEDPLGTFAAYSKV